MSHDLTRHPGYTETMRRLEEAKHLTSKGLSIGLLGKSTQSWAIRLGVSLKLSLSGRQTHLWEMG